MESENINNIEKREIGYFIMRTIPGKEDKFMTALRKSISKKDDHGIYSFFCPKSVKGYVFVEAENINKVVNVARVVPNSRGVIKTEIGFHEIEKYFEAEGEQIVINERDIVEIIGGPFKGDKAKVVRVIPGKDEVVVEPVDAPVPIPITLSIEDLRVIEANKDE